jgi:putative hemolysin
MERDRVDIAAVEQANVVIDEALERAGGNPTSREDADAWIKAKREAQQHPSLLNLARKFCDQHGYCQPRVQDRSCVVVVCCLSSPSNRSCSTVKLRCASQANVWEKP